MNKSLGTLVHKDGKIVYSFLSTKKRTSNKSHLYLSVSQNFQFETLDRLVNWPDSVEMRQHQGEEEGLQMSQTRMVWFGHTLCGLPEENCTSLRKSQQISGL